MRHNNMGWLSGEPEPVSIFLVTVTGKLECGKQNCEFVMLPNIDYLLYYNNRIYNLIRVPNIVKLYLKVILLKDFENNVKLLRSILMSILKKKKGQLVCERCGAGKRSANGFISHLQFCGKTEDVRLPM